MTDAKDKLWGCPKSSHMTVCLSLVLAKRQFKIHNFKIMKRKSRMNERFEEIGRVKAEQICILPGVLDDISLSGCKVHFPNPISLDMENDYEISVDFANTELKDTLKLLVHPQWQSADSSETVIGFKILCSPDTPKLKAVIELLKSLKDDDSKNISSLIINSSANIIQ